MSNQITPEELKAPIEEALKNLNELSDIVDNNIRESESKNPIYKFRTIIRKKRKELIKQLYP